MINNWKVIDFCIFLIFYYTYWLFFVFLMSLKMWQLHHTDVLVLL